MRRLKQIAAWGLPFGAAACIILALCGADDALAFMRRHAAVGVVFALSIVSLFAAVRGRRNVSALIMHLGFALALFGWAFNAMFGPTSGYVRLRTGQYGGIGRSAVQQDLPQFLVRLDDFKIDYWPDTGTVRQYTSKVHIGPYSETDDGLEAQEISVNHPAIVGSVGGGYWWVYQSSYEQLQNPHTGDPLYFTILQCVCDIGLPFAALGGVLLLVGALMYAVAGWRVRDGRGRDGLCPVLGRDEARPSQYRDGDLAVEQCYPRWLTILYALSFAGSFAMLVHRGLTTGHAPMQNMYEFLMCIAAAMPVLTWFSARRGERTFLQDAFLQAFVLVPVAFFMDGSAKHLMPALQSPFFVPHVGAYVLGYVLLVRAALGAGVRLVGAGFFLMTVGLVLGSAWGKVCWGNWWMFDPKEMWSLATWLVYAAYFHAEARLSPKARRIFLAIGAAMIVLTLTWVNLSRLFPGMHSYA